MNRKNKSSLAILGLLALQPMSGYEMKKYIDEGLCFFWSLSYGTIYPTLNKMERDGLVSRKRLSQAKRPGKSVYSITDKGRRLLETWQSGEVELPQVNDEILLRLFVGQEVPTEKHIDTLKGYHKKLQARHRYFKEMEAESTDAMRGSHHELLKYTTLRCGILTAEARMKWCQETIKSLQDEKQLQNPGVE